MDWGKWIWHVILEVSLPFMQAAFSWHVMAIRNMIKLLCQFWVKGDHHGHHKVKNLIDNTIKKKNKKSMLKLVAVPTGQAQQPSFKVNNCGTGKGTLSFSWPWKLKMEILKLFSEKKKKERVRFISQLWCSIFCC